MDLTIRLAGESGDGVILAGEVLTYAISRMGLKIFTFRTYPASVRGGPCLYQLRVSDWHAYSQGDLLDLLVAFDTEAISSHAKDLRPEGEVIFDQDRTPKNYSALPKHASGAPFTSIAKNELGFPRAKNMIIAGYAAARVGIPEPVLRDVLQGKLGSHGETVLAKDLAAIRLGLNLVPQQVRRRLPEGETNKIVLSGNQAMHFPPSMFTVLFAIARTSGWIAQWEEGLLDPEQRIARPRQVYVGHDRRKFLHVNNRFAIA